MAELNEKHKKLMKGLHICEENRNVHEIRWKQYIQYVLPQKTKFMNAYVEDLRVDTTATKNVHKLADGMFGSNCPQAINWFKFRFVNDALNNDDEAVTWMQEAQQRCYDAINRSNFYDILPVVLRNGCALETASMSIEEDVLAGKIICNALPIDEIYLMVDTNNSVYRLYRKFKITAEQAVISYGKEAVSSKIVDAFNKNTDMEIEIVHIISKRKDFDFTKSDISNMPWESITIDNTNNALIKESGFKKLPILSWRFEVRGNCPYGYGSTSDAMPDIFTINALMGDLLSASQKSLDPPLWFPEDAADDSTEAGAKNYYKDPGRQVYTVKSYIDSPINLELLQDIRESIKASYKADYFMPLMQLADKKMTAREVFERKSERITATGSVQGRVTSELITPFVERVFQIEYDAGRILPIPESIQGEALRIDYLSPLAQEQREVANAQGILASLDTVLPLMQLWPQTMDKIKPEVLVDELFDNTGMPQKAIVNDKDYQTIQKNKADQNAMMMQLQMQQIQAEIAAKAAQAMPAGGVK